MDTLGKEQGERNHISALLLKKYGTHKAAAEKMGLSRFTLSRALNGNKVELTTIVSILKATGHLERRTYIYPALNFVTFCHLNGIFNFTLK